MIMNTETITVKYVNQPKTPQSRSGSVKDTNGEFWGVPIPMLRDFAPDQTYTVRYDTREYQGRTYKDIKSIASALPVVQQATPTNGHAAPIGHNNPPVAMQDRGGVPPHVSNWVAHAIATGKIQDAPDMVRWAQWAYQAGLSMSQRPADAGEDAPF